MIFRPLEQNDLAWFIETRNSVRDMLHDPSKFSIEDAMKWFPTATSRYWIIVIDGSNVGYFRVTQISPFKVLIGADISPKHQKKGIASTAYPKFVNEILVPNGITELELQVLKINKTALSLYKKLGFVIYDESPIDLRMRVSVENLKTISPH